MNANDLRGAAAELSVIRVGVTGSRGLTGKGGLASSEIGSGDSSWVLDDS